VIIIVVVLLVLLLGFGLPAPAAKQCEQRGLFRLTRMQSSRRPEASWTFPSWYLHRDRCDIPLGRTRVKLRVTQGDFVRGGDRVGLDGS
jgi:hypothetical protein